MLNITIYCSLFCKVPILTSHPIIKFNHCYQSFNKKAGLNCNMDQFEKFLIIFLEPHILFMTRKMPSCQRQLERLRDFQQEISCDQMSQERFTIINFPLCWYTLNWTPPPSTLTEMDCTEGNQFLAPINRQKNLHNCWWSKK